MKLNDFLETYSSKLNPLQISFITKVFFKDYGEKGLDLITPEVRMDREDGSGSYYDIDFVVNTNFRKYAFRFLSVFFSFREIGKYLTLFSVYCIKG